MKKISLGGKIDVPQIGLGCMRITGLSKKEMEELYKTVYELKKELRDLKEELRK